MEHVKANPVASTGKAPVLFSAEARFVSGALITPDSGGVVADHGEVFSVARAEMVPGALQAEQQPDGSWAIPANRTGRATFLENDTSQPTTYGAEQESVQMDPDGRYARLPDDFLLQVNELYTFMRESGTAPTDDPVEFERRMWEMVHEEVDAATRVGQYVASLAVFGQHGMGDAHRNPSMYVEHVAVEMTARTGFDTIGMFRTGGAQAHTGLSNTMAGIQAAEAMQYLSPILAVPTLAGPFVHGGVAGNIGHPAFMDSLTAEQRAHMAAMKIQRGDLSHPYQSWRYLLRVLGSPSAGTWQTPAPDTKEGYLARADEQLAAGQINNIDRTNGWHTDRVRVVLDGSGANTVEDCSADTALGNPGILVPLQLLRAGLTTALEKMAMQGRDPRLAVARLLGTSALSREERLVLAHRTMLGEVSRYGTDANTYGRRPGEILPTLTRLVAQEAPFTRLTGAQNMRLRRAYATREQTMPAVQRWCVANNAETPTAQTWFDLGLNNPSVYMREQFVHLTTKKGMSEEAAIREIELGAAHALHNASQKAREGAAS
jgi:hypothetical protein